ncbi:MAG: hypothetical protein AAFV90_23820 [Cyanobacteria bacterium J06634_5]
MNIVAHRQPSLQRALNSLFILNDSLTGTPVRTAQPLGPANQPITGQPINSANQ